MEEIKKIILFVAVVALFSSAAVSTIPITPAFADDDKKKERGDNKDDNSGKKNKVLTGDGPPPNKLGKKGDIYIDNKSENFDIYEKTGKKKWGLVGDLRGPAGPPGTSSSGGSKATFHVKGGGHQIQGYDEPTLRFLLTDNTSISITKNPDFYTPEFLRGYGYIMPESGYLTNLFFYGSTDSRYSDFNGEVLIILPNAAETTLRCNPVIDASDTLRNKVSCSNTTARVSVSAGDVVYLATQATNAPGEIGFDASYYIASFQLR